MENKSKLPKMTSLEIDGIFDKNKTTKINIVELTIQEITEDEKLQPIVIDSKKNIND